MQTERLREWEHSFEHLNLLCDDKLGGHVEGERLHWLNAKDHSWLHVDSLCAGAFPQVAVHLLSCSWCQVVGGDIVLLCDGVDSLCAGAFLQCAVHVLTCCCCCGEVG